MLSARSLFQEILDNDESFQLFCSIAASGEAQGGWENGRIAALVPESMRDLAPKITRHGADEDKHGRIFNALLKKRGLRARRRSRPRPTTRCCWSSSGIGLAHEKLRRDEPLTEQDIVTYLAHSRVTEQRAADQMDMLRKHFGDHPEVGKAISMICDDEDNHLAYCHEELLRLAPPATAAPSSAPCASARSPRSRLPGRQPRRHGPHGPHPRLVRGQVRRCSRPASTRCTRTSGWAAGAAWFACRMPERRDALGGPATTAPEFACRSPRFRPSGHPGAAAAHPRSQPAAALEQPVQQHHQPAITRSPPDTPTPSRSSGMWSKFMP